MKKFLEDRKLSSYGDMQRCKSLNLYLTVIPYYLHDTKLVFDLIYL